MEGTGSGSCPLTGLGACEVASPGFVTREVKVWGPVECPSIDRILGPVSFKTRLNIFL